MRSAAKQIVQYFQMAGDSPKDRACAARDSLFIVASGLLDAQAVRRTLETLPAEILHELERLLEELQQVDYEWKPFLIGPGFPDESVPSLSAQTREVHQLIATLSHGDE